MIFMVDDIHGLLCIQGSLLEEVGGPYEVLGIKPRLATSNANTLPLLNHLSTPREAIPLVVGVREALHSKTVDVSGERFESQSSYS